MIVEPLPQNNEDTEIVFVTEIAHTEIDGSDTDSDIVIVTQTVVETTETPRTESNSQVDIELDTEVVYVTETVNTEVDL